MKDEKIKIGIIGLGLLGTSLGLALNGNDRYLRFGWARRKESLEYAREIGACDVVSDNVEEILSKVDLAVVCIPVKAIISFAEDNLKFFRAGMLVTDVGSVKYEIVRTLHPILKARDVEFVGSHPMAGSEQSGAEAAYADLYKGANIFVTPVPGNSKEAVEKVARLWLDCGGKVIFIGPGEHDRVVAYSSHLVHVVASILNLSVLDVDVKEKDVVSSACAGGFRDSTRIAASSPEMWEEIIELNAGNILSALDNFENRICEFRKALEKKDFDKVRDFLTRSADLRREWLSGK